MNNCLNLCEILSDNNIDVILRNDFGIEYDRVYFGSYFCSRYFLSINYYERLINHFKDKEIRLTLVVPVFTENDLKKGKDKINKILSIENQYIDEVTVNDIGMVSYFMNNHKDRIVNFGRLFFKESRDVRVQSFTTNRLTSAQIDVPMLFLKRGGMIEIDETNNEMLIDSEYNDLAIHFPFTYMTTGNICKFAGIHKKIDDKFRPNSCCQLECQNIYEHYNEKIGDNAIDLFRIGRTIYYERKDRAVLNVEIERKIYFPFYEVLTIMRKDYEDFSPFK